jgi:hypothetical protein
MQCGNLSPDSVLKIFIVLNTLINTNVKECEKLKESNADVIVSYYFLKTYEGIKYSCVYFIYFFFILLFSMYFIDSFLYTKFT